MRKWTTLVIPLACAAALACGCGLLPRGAATATPAPTATRPSPTAVPATATPIPPQPTVTNPPPPPTSPPEPITATPAATPGGKPTAAPRIILSEVSANAAVPGVLHVAGKAQVFEATLSIRLVDGSGEVIASGFAMASMGAPEWGDFSIDFFYPPPATATRVTVQAFEVSPKDGSPNSLVEASAVLVPAPELAGWQTFINDAYGFEVMFPATWSVNLGSVHPAPPLATKLSSYRERTPGEPLDAGQAEVWINVADAPSVAEMQLLEARGYQRNWLVVGGQQAVRYTAATPAHGVYDIVYTMSGQREYRMQLSAATHEFDALFALMLATFSVTP